MAKQLRAFSALLENSKLVYSPQIPVSPSTGDLTLSPGLYKHLHTSTYTHTKQIFHLLMLEKIVNYILHFI